MAISIYTPEEVQKLREGGAILSRILGDLARKAAPGVTTEELDAYAEAEMRAVGGEPAFKGYKAGGAIPFPGTVCTCINDEVVHAPPVPARALKEGDLLKMDIGLRYKGLVTDMAISVPIGKVSDEIWKLAYVTQQSLFAGVDAIKLGGEVRDIGRAIQPLVEKHGYGIVRDLVGHGVGHEVHEDPKVPNYDDPDMPRVKLKEGMVIAIEPMVNTGSWEVVVADDDWTIESSDRSISSHFEVTVAITKDGPEIITPQPITVKKNGGFDFV
jgi:methionyl aminopeptidase